MYKSEGYFSRVSKIDTGRVAFLFIIIEKKENMCLILCNLIPRNTF